MRHSLTLSFPVALALLTSCGDDGPAGADGTPWLAVVSDAGAECPDGGVVVDYGYDGDGDEALSDDETVDSVIVCSGGASAETLTETVQDFTATDDCRYGTQVLNIGTDDGDGGGAAGDGVLQAGEIDASVEDCLVADVDADGYVNTLDNCPEDYNPFQVDGDLDLIGDVCDDSIGDPVMAWVVTADDDAALWQVDVGTGEATLVGHTGLRLSNIATAADGTLYAHTSAWTGGDAGDAQPYTLYELDQSTGAATLVTEVTYDGGEGVQLGAMTFLSDGSLVGWNRNDGPVWVDMTTGMATPVDGEAGDLYTYRYGMCRTADDMLLLVNGDNAIYKVDPADGDVVEQGTMDSLDGGEGLRGDCDPTTLLYASISKNDGKVYASQLTADAHGETFASVAPWFGGDPHYLALVR